MTKEEYAKKIQEISEDEEFIECAKNVKNTEELSILLNEKGFDITAEDIKAIMEAEENELSFGEMTDVSGGAYVKDICLTKIISSPFPTSTLPDPMKNFFNKLRNLICK